MPAGRNPFIPKIMSFFFFNSHLLLQLSICYRSSDEKFLKYPLNSSCVIISLILMTALFYQALI